MHINTSIKIRTERRNNSKSNKTDIQDVTFSPNAIILILKINFLNKFTLKTPC